MTAHQYPVQEITEELRQRLLSHNRVILQAPPGAGKSTILPLELFKESWLNGKKIIMLEPRRLAARSVAMRMASLLSEEIGETVGYRIRFEAKVSSKTGIEVVTEGILTRMIQTDDSLEDVAMVIFDEFHERSLQADVGLALALQVQQILRDDLRILIMSATLDGEKLSTLLGAPVVTSKGRQFPIELNYIKPDQNERLPQQVARVIRKALVEQKGDLLVFLPGAGEIARTAELITTDDVNVKVFQLYGDLSFSRQQEAIKPSKQGERKIVLATSIAETSLTIEGITTVIDGGYSRVPRFDPRSGLTRLETVRVSKDSADQRAGRAGRLGPGVCYRLWPEGIHASLIGHRPPEILEADLSSLVLELAQWGVSDLNSLTWITPPPAGAVSQARELLEQLEALSENRITERGKKMLTLPTHPRIAHMLLEAQADSAYTAGVASDVAAVLEERDPLPKNASADISVRVEVLRRWRSGERVAAEQSVLDRIEKIAMTWRKFLNLKIDNSNVVDTEVGKVVMAAYPERIARQVSAHSERYKLYNGRMVQLPQHDALTKESWLAVAQLDSGVNDGKIFLAAPLSESDLVSHAHEQLTTLWDDDRQMVASFMEKKIGGLVLSRKQVTTITDEKRTQVVCEMIQQKGLRVLEWDDKLEAWQSRVESLRLWRPNENWPEVAEEKLLANIHGWLAPFLNGIGKLSELQRLEPEMILPTILPYELQSKLNAFAPEKLEVPSGSFIRLRYFPDGAPPVLEVRLQEVFGMLETPMVNEGRTKIILHLLSPGYKPVQVTQDLKSFWSNTYSEVRKELRTRYPKHSWPEDPWTAKAVRGVKRGGR